MEWADSEVLSALRILVPGFIATAVFFAFTVQRKQSDLQKLIDALVFSTFVQLLVELLKVACVAAGRICVIGKWGVTVDFVWSVIVAILLGFGVAWTVNTDNVYSLLRRWRLTKKTSRPTVWYSCFSDLEAYVVLNLVDGRRLYGWPAQWPSAAEEGHVQLTKAVWLAGSGEENQREVELPLNSSVLINCKEIRWIEFLTDPTLNEGKADEK